jgi:hypothetical protein
VGRKIALLVAEERDVGRPLTIAASPAAPTSARTPIPSAVPKLCGIVGLNANAAPDARRRTLFGPGEPVLTIEKATRASHWSMAGR